ncbi:MAG TPA: hypothetical protein PKE00_11675, partial [Planctomycetota bacterium]|nr:hypothetical protein [Planctomycetota bacterium]
MSRNNSGPAPELDPLVLVKARALFAKAPLPSNEIYVLRNLYRSTKDHRVLEALPKGVVGHTQQAVYALLGQLSIILGEVHEEATCDRLDEELMRSLETAKEKLDQRGLHMMRVLVLGRAAQLRNQPGPHRERALASLKASFDRANFAPGEDLQRAKYLEMMTVGDDVILDERLRQLEALYQHTEEGSSTQVGIAQSWFAVLAGTNASKARDVLAAAIEANIAKNDGRLVTSTRDAWQQLENAWISARDFGRPERMLLRLHSKETQAGARFYLERRTSHVRIQALRHGGTVSIGTGLELHDKLATMLENELAACSAYEFTQVLDDRMSLATAGHARKLDPAVHAFIGFANKVLPGLVEKTPDLARLYQVSQTIQKISSEREALAYAIARHGDQPAFWRRLGRDVWTQIGYRMAQWRHEIAVVGQLSGPLLSLACVELEDDLTTLSN